MSDIEVTFAEVRTGRYSVVDRDSGFEYLHAARQIMGPLARLLYDNGAADDDRIVAYRKGAKTPALVGTIGYWRSKTVQETATAGPRLVKYKEFSGLGGEDE